MKHSPEPWKIAIIEEIANGHKAYSFVLYDADGRVISSLYDQRPDGERILACVNAMKDIEDPQAFRERAEFLMDMEIEG